MKKQYILILLILTGCELMNGSIGVYDPYTGSKGLEAHFLENNPPETVKESRSFRIGFRVSNEGAYNIHGAKLRLEYNSADLNVPNHEKTIDLYGRSTHIQNGESSTVFWEAEALPVSGVHKTDVGLTATYNYQTNAFVDYCIDPGIYTNNRDKTCTMQMSISPGSQGAPVAVSRIESEIFAEDQKGEIEMTVHVENVDDGWVSYDGLDTVKISASMAGQQLMCEPVVIDLEDGESICTYNYNALEEYKTPLHIQLEYTYRSIVEKQDITIRPD